MEEGEIEIDSIEQIAIQDITHQLAIESGFLGVIDLLKMAKHGPGDNVYLIHFHYIPPLSQKRARVTLRVDSSLLSSCSYLKGPDGAAEDHLAAQIARIVKTQRYALHIVRS